MKTHLTDIGSPQANISPIVGVFDTQSQPFSVAIERCNSVVPNASAIAGSCLFFANTAANSFQLTQEEIAAINLYTIECDFYRVLNATLRERDREKLKPFFPYLKHLLVGLNKLPSFSGKLWRGVKLNLKGNYPKGKEFFWWSFSSCTVDLEVLEREQFCGKSGDRSIFCISSQRGKNIKMFSNFADEGEVLLMPGYFVVRGVMESGNGLTIIDIEELPPPFDIFIGIPKTAIANNIIPNNPLPLSFPFNISGKWITKNPTTGEMFIYHWTHKDGEFSFSGYQETSYKMNGTLKLINKTNVNIEWKFVDFKIVCSGQLDLSSMKITGQYFDSSILLGSFVGEKCGDSMIHIPSLSGKWKTKNPNGDTFIYHWTHKAGEFCFSGYQEPSYKITGTLKLNNKIVDIEWKFVDFQIVCSGQLDLSSMKITGKYFDSSILLGSFVGEKW